MLLPHMAENVSARLLELQGLIAKNLRLLRDKRGMSQETLADRAGLHRTQLSVIERGRRNMKLETLISLAAALDVTEIELLTDSGEEPKEPNRGRPRKVVRPADE
ncbi:helix-turn-helix transcriptional regulator [Paraburkholderia sp. IMGN_8]|uniref:helix-turn-helix domain-containing protein n=1 Tax=Paraburkholderia sp. IMGN_8 TaxID=3136564 RepID=UPI0031012FB5